MDLDLNYDTLVMTESWCGQNKCRTKITCFTTSEPIIITKGPKKGQKRFPDDRSRGVNMLLLRRAQRTTQAG